MKRTFLKNWMMAALLLGACCGVVACDDNDEGGTTPPPTDPDVTAVCGDYTGTMSILDVAPLAGDGSGESAATEVEATVTEQSVEFSDFPVRDLIVRVLGTEEGVDEIIAAIGPVDYDVPYTARMSNDNLAVEMALEPAPLKLFLADSGTSEETGEPTGVEIEVTIGSVGAALYVLESSKLGFDLSVTEVKIAGVAMDGFEPLALDFDLARK